MSAFGIHAVCILCALFFTGSFVASVRRIVRLNEIGKYRLFWLLPYAVASLAGFCVFSFMAFESVDANGNSDMPQWLEKVVYPAFGFWAAGILAKNIAPKGMLVPDLNSLASCVGVFLLWMSFLVPHAYHNYLFWAGVALLILGDRSVIGTGWRDLLCQGWRMVWGAKTRTVH